ncbi:mercuric transporter MerT family protein [Chelativorans intermedius]|uniref:Mercuric transport protein MerT n=1 Tax=Chelativorans intermedius TaxID=515947 RepID=A0ABV6DAM1_9HYPH|nr:mercuric transporter MerT family protein [Chelativorans intermedius]MCT9000148.1 mercuric transporter MerT family protein [Chelativorans intermedius]
MNTDVNPASDSAATSSGVQRRRWYATGGLLGAVLASSCCILPLALVMLGVSGAWIGSLTALEPLKPAFAVISIAFIALGFRQVYFRPNPACAEGACSTRPQSGALVRSALWLSAILVTLALGIEWWAPLFY